MRIVRNPGRVAGLWYLLLIIVDPLRLIYIPSKLFVLCNPASTVNNIAAHEFLFRMGIASELAGAVILIFLSLAFYRLFVAVDRSLAILVVIFGGVMPALIYFVGTVDDFGTLMVGIRARFLRSHSPLPSARYPQKHPVQKMAAGGRCRILVP